MKITLPLLPAMALLLLVPSLLRAQPVLTYTAYAPQTGDQYTVGHSQYYYAGSTGANQVWNFSTASVSTNETYSVVPVSAVPCGNQYPPATQSIGLGGGYAMLQVSASDYLYYGTTITPSMPGFIYSDPEKLFQFPMNYANSYTDFSQAVDNSGPVYRRGMDTITYAGYGTIQTPYATYTNVICIHRRYVYADSSQFSYNTCGMNFYYWFAPGYRYPVAQSWQTDPACALSHGTLFLQTIVSGEVAIASVEPQVRIFPNPFVSEITCTAPGKEGKTVLLSDLSGRVVRAFTLTNETTTLDLQNLEAGAYILTIDGRSKRIIKAEN